jgi:hypothetical protein
MFCFVFKFIYIFYSKCIVCGDCDIMQLYITLVFALISILA